MKQFVGFGFGPIQSGLMLLEAQNSGKFDRFTIVEVAPDIVDATRRNGNSIVVNVARRDGIEKKTLTDIDILNPNDRRDREKIGEAIGEADELATAIPNVDLYSAGNESSVASLLAANIDAGRKQILYASENNNYAAEILGSQILKQCPSEKLNNFQILDTVIGKMSGVVQDASVIKKLDLETMVPDNHRAVLVEEFNRILVSAVHLSGVVRGIEVFEEKEDLLPFEEVKLFGHNAIHALLGYLAFDKGYHVMSEIRHDTELMALGRRAFIDESGVAMVRKHGHVREPLFTPAGYAAHADDLLERMTNPYLNDEIERVCRDTKRKLGYGDRLIGTMREALKQDVVPRILARGAAAALRYIVVNGEVLGVEIDYPTDPDRLTDDHMRAMLEAIWGNEAFDEYKDTCVQLILSADEEAR